MMSGKSFVRFTVVLFVVCVVIAAIAAAIFLPNLKIKDGQFIFQTALVSAKQPVQPTNFDNGVYYFEAVGSHFGNSLSFWLEDHQCKVEGIAPGNLDGLNVMSGYFVVCRYR